MELSKASKRYLKHNTFYFSTEGSLYSTDGETDCDDDDCWEKIVGADDDGTYGNVVDIVSNRDNCYSVFTTDIGEVVRVDTYLGMRKIYSTEQRGGSGTGIDMIGDSGKIFWADSGLDQVFSGYVTDSSTKKKKSLKTGLTDVADVKILQSSGKGCDKLFVALPDKGIYTMSCNGDNYTKYIHRHQAQWLGDILELVQTLLVHVEHRLPMRRPHGR